MYFLDGPNQTAFMLPSVRMTSNLCMPPKIMYIYSLITFLLCVDQLIVCFGKVTPYIGFERWDDLGHCVRFYLPYVYINLEQKWFRL